VVADAERERESSRAFSPFGTREKIIDFFLFSNVSFSLGCSNLKNE
jgi:hypothetical protein